MNRKKLAILMSCIDSNDLTVYAKQTSITRAGLSSNPLQRYSFTGGDVFKTDELVTTNGIITEIPKSKTYDFSGKIVGQSYPMKIYYAPISIPTDGSLASPTNSWSEENNQGQIDSIKTQNGEYPAYYSTQINGAKFQIMIELDLSDLANSLGGNTKLKEQLTGITVDCWTSGSGSNGGVNTNGVSMYWWRNAYNMWSLITEMSNTTSNISKMSWMPSGNDFSFLREQQAISTSNKLFLLVSSQYPSNSTIASSVSLDYISIKIDYKERTVTKDGLAFVGGDTATYDFDFGLKVAGSTFECPMKIYNIGSNALVLPNSQGLGNYLETSQSEIDKLKTIDLGFVTVWTSNNNEYAQIMVELDLTPLCNAFYGGSTSALISALKNPYAITFSVYANGSGSNAGVQTNGVQLYSYWNGNWILRGINNTGAISLLISGLDNSVGNFVGNKFYVLIASQYPSNGSTIPSSVSLDYINIKVDLARTPDVVKPIPVNLPRYWGMLVKGISPSWDGNTSYKNIFHIFQNSNDYTLNFWNDRIRFAKIINSRLGELLPFIASNKKYNTFNVLCGQGANGMFAYVLQNNGVVIKEIDSNTDFISGQVSFQIMNANNTQQSDAFAESFTLIDLEKIGKIQFGGELITNGDFSQGSTGWIIDGAGSTSFTNGQLAITDIKTVYQEFTVLPNSQYRVSAGTNTGSISCAFFNNGSWISDSANLATSGEMIVTTPQNCNRMIVRCMNSATTGTVTFDNISLKQIIQNGFTDAEAEILLRGIDVPSSNELVVNGDFSQGSTGWTLGAGTWDYSNGIASGTSTGSLIFIYQHIPVLPNSQYTLSLVGTGVIDVDLFDSNGTKTIGFANLQNSIITTQATTVRMTLYAVVRTTGTFTFDNISLKYVKPSGTVLAIPNRELFDINKYDYLFSDFTQVIGNSIVYNSSSASPAGILFYISVLPNNKYEVDATNIGGGWVNVVCFYNNSYITETVLSPPSATFITPNNCNKVMIRFLSTGSGIYTWSNISLKLKM